MMRYLKILILAMIVIGIFVGPANAVQLKNRNGAAFGTGSNTTTSYKISLEVYSNSAGVSTIADDTVSRGLIQIGLTQVHQAGDTVNMTISSGNALFNSAGPGYKFGLCDVAASGSATVCDPGEIVGFLTPSGATLQNLGLSIATNITAPVTLWLVQWLDTNANNQYDGGETLLNGTGLYVLPGLNASCDNRPIITISFSSPRETTSAPANFAVITPQFKGTGPRGNDLTAELNADTNFRTFVLDSGHNVDSDTEIIVNSFIKISDNSGTKEMWIAYASEGYISFNVNSIIGEPDASLYLDGDYCSPSADSKVFSCSSYGTLVGNHNLSLQVDGYSTNKTTTWTLSNFGNLCVTLPPVVIGVWYGVIFADVPPGYWAEIYINTIYNVGITVGCAPDDPGTPENERRYCPENNVTREEMAALIVRAVEGEPPLNHCDAGTPFPDVSSDMWSCRYIKRLKELEITTGYSDGRYGPYDIVLREQMAAFLVRAVEGEPPLNYCYSGSPFTDVSYDMWSCRYIKRLKELEITTGYGDGRYGPYDEVTKAQMAAFLARAFLEME